MEMDYPKTRMDNFFAKAAGSELADNSMEPITDREYWINELAARLAEGGLVPPIEEGDDGKVLTVDEGAAVWAEGGGGKTFVSYAVNEEEGYDYLTMNCEDLYEAFLNGFVFTQAVGEHAEGYCQIISASWDKDGNIYEFVIGTNEGLKSFNGLSDGFPENHWD